MLIIMTSATEGEITTVMNYRIIIPATDQSDKNELTPVEVGVLNDILSLVDLDLVANILDVRATEY